MKLYEPSARDLRIYESCCEGGESQQEVAKRYKISQQRVSRICRQVDQWLAPQLADRVRELKARHTQKLENIYRRTILAFEASQTGGQAGNAAFLAQGRGALDDIRRIWGANEPERVAEGVAGISTGGMTRQEVLDEYQQRFDSLMTRIQESPTN